MFDIGFFELALIGVVLLVVMGPERLPEVARQLAFVIRKARGWMYSMKAEMSMSDDPMLQELKQAKDELTDLGRDMRQLGDDFAQETAQLNDRIDLDSEASKATVSKAPISKPTEKKTVSKPKKAPAKRKANKKSAKKVTKKVTKKTTKKVAKKATKKTSKKKVAKKGASKS